MFHIFAYLRSDRYCKVLKEKERDFRAIMLFDQLGIALPSERAGRYWFESFLLEFNLEDKPAPFRRKSLDHQVLKAAVDSKKNPLSEG